MAAWPLGLGPKVGGVPPSTLVEGDGWGTPPLQTLKWFNAPQGQAAAPVEGIEVHNFSPFHAILHFFAIFRNFSAICFLLVSRAVGVLCVPCAEMLLLEASGRLVTAPPIARNFMQFFAIFHIWI